LIVKRKELNKNKVKLSCLGELREWKRRMTGGRNGAVMVFKMFVYIWQFGVGVIDKSTDWLYYY
jgi:hypothetical protein